MARRAASPASDASGLAPRLRDMTVEQYAELSAECACFPQRADQVLLRYGVSSATERAALDQFWQQRMIADTALCARWLDHVERWRQRLLAGSAR